MYRFRYGAFPVCIAIGSGLMFASSRSQSPKKSLTEQALMHIVEKRGYKDKDELLLAHGKQNTKITYMDAVNLMQKELGHSGSIEYANRMYYSSPGECERLLEQYNECVRSGDHVLFSFKLKALKKYCGYHPNEDPI